MPKTPDVRKKCSKRSFAGQVRAWRRRLHEWDLPNAAVDEPRMVTEKASEEVNNTGFKNSQITLQGKRRGQYQGTSPNKQKKVCVTSRWTDVTCNPSAVNPSDIPEDLLISYSDDEL